MALSLLRSRPMTTRHAVRVALFLQRLPSDLNTAHQSRSQSSETTPPSTEPAAVEELRPTMQQRSVIVALLNDPYRPIGKIARTVDLSYPLVESFVRNYKQTGSISTYRHKRGPNRRAYPQSEARLTTQQHAEILTLFENQGLSIPEIARQMSLPDVRVWEFVKYRHAAKDPTTPTAGQPKSPPLEPLNMQQRLEVIRLLNEQNLKAYTISRITSLPYLLVLSLVRAYQKTGSIDKHPKPKVKTTFQQREDIISYYTIGVPTVTSAAVMSIPLKTVYGIISKYKKTAENVQRHQITLVKRQEIVASHEKGTSSKRIALRESLPLTIVDGIIKWYKETGSVDVCERKTYRKLTAVAKDQLRQLRAEHPSWTIVDIAREFGTGQGTGTIRRFFKAEEERILTRDTVAKEAAADKSTYIPSGE
jgi:transposase